MVRVSSKQIQTEILYFSSVFCCALGHFSQSQKKKKKRFYQFLIKKLSSTDIKLSKTQLYKIIQLGGFLGRLLSSLLKTGLPLIKNVI